MDTVRKWRAQISEIDEMMGRPVKYPHALLQYHIHNELEKQNNIIKNSASDIKENIRQSTAIITGTLEEGFNAMIETNTIGFNKINENIKSIQDSINLGFTNIVNTLDNISIILSWGFSKLIELNKQKNLLLTDIIQLLNIPDIEKERKLYIEKGLEFIKKAIIDETFIDDSKKYFEMAINIEPNDYYVLYNLGIIHFFYRKHLDLDKAIHYFLKAGKYAHADIAFKPIKYSTYPSSFKNKINPLTIATYSFLYTGRSYYYLNDIDNALIYVNKAYELSQNITEILFDKAKFLICKNKVQESLSILSDLIEKDRYITLKVITDADFMKHNEVTIFLQNLRDMKINEAKKKYELATKLIRNDSIFKDKLLEVSKLIKKNTYLSALAALDIL